MRKLTSRITIETDEQLKVSVSRNRSRDTMLCGGGGEPRRTPKCMHAYHTSLMAPTSRSRFMLLDFAHAHFKLDTWVKFMCTVMKVHSQMKEPFVDTVFAEQGSHRCKCKSGDLQMLCLYCSLSWLTHIEDNPPLLIWDLVCCRRKRTNSAFHSLSSKSFRSRVTIESDVRPYSWISQCLQWIDKAV